MKKYILQMILFLVYLSEPTNRKQIELLIPDLSAQLQQIMVRPHSWTFVQRTSQSPDHRMDN